ncbi:MAG TPA: hypothetical protein VIL30_14420 [Ramlibacter sp.]|jgi:hypothetical protein
MSFDPTNPSHCDALREVQSVQRELGFHCADANRDEDAAVNLVEGKPAFASGYSYSNAFGSLLASAANRLGSIEAAQDELAEHSALDDYRDEALLDRLYPLNRAAELDLMVAYQRCGTWIDSTDLRRRVMCAAGVVPPMYSDAVWYGQTMQAAE